MAQTCCETPACVVGWHARQRACLVQEARHWERSSVGAVLRLSAAARRDVCPRACMIGSQSPRAREAALTAAAPGLGFSCCRTSAATLAQASRARRESRHLPAFITCSRISPSSTVPTTAFVLAEASLRGDRAPQMRCRSKSSKQTPSREPHRLYALPTPPPFGRSAQPWWLRAAGGGSRAGQPKPISVCVSLSVTTRAYSVRGISVAAAMDRVIVSLTRSTTPRADRTGNRSIRQT